MKHLIVMRHGATQANLDGLRCGGDYDLPLTGEGRLQVIAAAMDLRAQGWRIDAIVASDLRRTRESAELVAEQLGSGLTIHLMPAFRERLLGGWNGQPIEATEAALRRGDTPPGGESRADFAARIDAALDALLDLDVAHPLLVGSRGVARVLRERAGLAEAPPLRNAELLRLPLLGLRPSRAAMPAGACA